jgi:hypothetical protein
VKGERGFARHKTSRFHLLSPGPVMRRDNELRIFEMSLEKFAELVSMAGIDGHYDIVQQRKGEFVAEEPLHER